MSIKRDIGTWVEDTTKPNREVCQALEALDTGWKARDALSLFASDLYRRDRRVFLPLLQNVVSRSSLSGDQNAWLAELDNNRDIKLHREVLAYELNKLRWGRRVEAWRDRLKARIAVARPDEIAVILDMYDCGFELDDAVAQELYPAAPGPISELIVRQSQRDPWMMPSFDATLDTARELGEDENFFRIYKECVPPQRWQDDVKLLLTEYPDPSALDEALERYHPNPNEGFQGGAVFLMLLEHRGTDVLGYVLRHIHDFPSWAGWGGGNKAWRDIMTLAETQGWWALWGAIASEFLSTSAFNDLVMGTLKSGSDRNTQIRKLVYLGGAQNMSRFHALKARIGLGLYATYPELASGPFRPNWVGALDRVYEDVAKAAAKAGDAEMVDFLAAGAMFQAPTPWSKSRPPVDWFVDHYNHLPPRMLAPRLINVLSQTADQAQPWTRGYLKDNPLYVFLLDEPSRLYASDGLAAGIRDLLETANRDAQAFALGALADPRGREAAVTCADHLITMMIGRVPRDLRLLALHALVLACEDSEALAARTLPRLRTALRYCGPTPRDRVIEAIGALLYRWPGLRGPGESVVVFGLESSGIQGA